MVLARERVERSIRLPGAEAGFTLVEDVLLAVGTSEGSSGYPGCTITEV
jgi:hypothetical protein